MDETIDIFTGSNRYTLRYLSQESHQEANITSTLKTCSMLVIATNLAYFSNFSITDDLLKYLD